MKCPNCGHRDQVSVCEGDGFCQDVRECTDCGCIWTFDGDKRAIIKEASYGELCLSCEQSKEFCNGKVGKDGNCFCFTLPLYCG